MIDYPFSWENEEKLQLADMLSGLQNNDIFMDFLEGELKRLDRLNRTETDDTIMRQRQGGCHVLWALTNMILGSRDFHKVLHNIVAGGS